MDISHRASGLVQQCVHASADKPPRSRKISRGSDCRDTPALPNRIAAGSYGTLRQ